jgi:hypothetical protein
MPPNRWPADPGTTPAEDMTNRMDLVGQLIGSSPYTTAANAGPGYVLGGGDPRQLDLVGGPGNTNIPAPPDYPTIDPTHIGRIHPMPPVRPPNPLQTMADIGIHPDMVSAPSIHQQLHPDFYQRLMALTGAIRGLGGNLDIFSGARTPARQNQLWQAALGRFGGDEKLAARVVAKPGESLHDPLAGLKYGLGPGAIGGDLRGDLAMAYRLAPRFGLDFPLTSQPWHVQLAGLPQV